MEFVNLAEEGSMSQHFVYHYINEDLAHHEIFRAKVGKGGILINHYNMLL